MMNGTQTRVGRLATVEKIVLLILGTLTFALLTAVGAQIRLPLPFTPVPLTPQTFFIILAGAYLGRNWGTLSQLTYIVLGVAGLPFFTGTGTAAAAGWGRLAGPTGGYLVGFVAAAWFVGRALELVGKSDSKNNYLRTSAVMVLGSMLILAFGSAWLAVLFKGNLVKAFILGFWPFIPGDILKSLAAAAIVRTINKR